MHQENDTLVFQRRNHRSDVPVWQVDIKDGSLHSASRDQRHGFPDRHGWTDHGATSIFYRVSQIEADERLVLDN